MNYIITIKDPLIPSTLLYAWFTVLWNVNYNYYNNSKNKRFITHKNTYLRCKKMWLSHNNHHQTSHRACHQPRSLYHRLHCDRSLVNMTDIKLNESRRIMEKGQRALVNTTTACINIGIYFIRLQGYVHFKVRWHVPQSHITFSRNSLLIYYYFNKLSGKNKGTLPCICARY